MQVIDKWWPGTESNHRHADFQGDTQNAPKPLTPLDVANPEVLGIPAVLAAFEREFAGFQSELTTADHADGAP
jgi:hypothetical protein